MADEGRVNRHTLPLDHDLLIDSLPLHPFRYAFIVTQTQFDIAIGDKLQQQIFIIYDIISQKHFFHFPIIDQNSIIIPFRNMKMNNLSIDQKFSFSLILSYPIRKIIKNRLTLFKIIRGIIITENSNFVEKDERGKR